MKHAKESISSVGGTLSVHDTDITKTLLLIRRAQNVFDSTLEATS